MSSGQTSRSLRVCMLFAAAALTACAPRTEVTQVRDDAPAREMRALADRCEAIHHQMQQAGSMRPPAPDMKEQMDQCEQKLGVARIAPAVKFW